MIKILAACGAGVNSSHQIKTAITEAMKERGFNDISVDAVLIKDITPEMMSKYDVFTPISEPNLGFEITIPVVEAGPILYRMPAMSTPVFNKLEEILKNIKK